MATPLYPLLFRPVYQAYVWGGTRIPERYPKPPCDGLCAESWEVSARDEAPSIVSNGPLAGKTLGDVIAAEGPAIAGLLSGQAFPLLVKLIDARERLSVQVHPDDAAAAQFGGEAKTEMWYVLDAPPGAGVYAGLKPGTTSAEFRAAIANHTIEALLEFMPVTAGDTVFIPGGRVHAIGAGCLLLEVQQSSNTTYRIYDWGRLGQDGQPRELHVEQAMDVIKWDDAGSPTATAASASAGNENALVERVACAHFTIRTFTLVHTQPLPRPGAGAIILFAETGPVELVHAGNAVQLQPGACCLVPACLSDVQLIAPSEPARVVHITAPRPR